MSKLLLDTNVLIYSIDEDSRFFEKARSIFSKQLELFTTSKNISEFLSVVTRIPKNPLSLKDALIVVEDFTSSVNILYPDEKSFSVFKKMLKKYQPTGLQIHDYEILSIGLANNIFNIATFNEKDFMRVNEIKLFTS
jgi:predicted nucleic acid-binding protein